MTSNVGARETLPNELCLLKPASEKGRITKETTDRSGDLQVDGHSSSTPPVKGTIVDQLVSSKLPNELRVLENSSEMGRITKETMDRSGNLQVDGHSSSTPPVEGSIVDQLASSKLEPSGRCSMTDAEIPLPQPNRSDAS